MTYLPVLKAKKYDIIGVKELELAPTKNVFPIFEMPTVEDAWLGRAHVSLQRDKPRYLIECTIKNIVEGLSHSCLLYTSPSPRDQRGSRMPSSA